MKSQRLSNEPLHARSTTHSSWTHAPKRLRLHPFKDTTMVDGTSIRRVGIFITHLDVRIVMSDSSFDHFGALTNMCTKEPVSHLATRP